MIVAVCSPSDAHRRNIIGAPKSISVNFSCPTVKILLILEPLNSGYSLVSFIASQSTGQSFDLTAESKLPLKKIKSIDDLSILCVTYFPNFTLYIHNYRDGMRHTDVVSYNYTDLTGRYSIVEKNLTNFRIDTRYVEQHITHTATCGEVKLMVSGYIKMDTGNTTLENVLLSNIKTELESVLVSNIKTKQQRDIVNEFKTHWRAKDSLQTLTLACHPKRSWVYILIKSNIPKKEHFFLTIFPDFEIFEGREKGRKKSKKNIFEDKKILKINIAQ